MKKLGCYLMTILTYHRNKVKYTVFREKFHCYFLRTQSRQIFQENSATTKLDYQNEMRLINTHYSTLYNNS